MGNENRDTRKAALDLQHYLSLEQQPPLHTILRTFQLRYGFGKTKLKNLLAAYPEYEADFDTDQIKRVE